ncbi:LysM peptidoglycan-binding domain-containing protein [Neobacillus mesonae]|uniref:cell division suppressor protein YneA n=1 Tax=Neobacillus mesonae TaxID=1193713 RepID=UPI00203CF3F1|nr:LysM peptidoglycan-binding domain-containing protein [Neobacillus mesonae]MCM3568132.1 LysM peptidoglycan-binding domain-containing protein [Neobacillus mesonae]
MKKLWNQYSYAIILILLSCSFAIILTIQNGTEASNHFVKITVSEGDSLWKISEQYSGQHSMSNKEFVNWVKKHNENTDDQLFPGEEIIIPISNDVSPAAELASAPEK